MQIARRYMQGIDFGAQPYLAYQHLDAGHLDIQIVLVKFAKDGSDMDNIARNQSAKVREDIAQAFRLVKAKPTLKSEAKQSLTLPPLQPIHHGKTEARNAIAAVLNRDSKIH